MLRVIAAPQKTLPPPSAELCEHLLFQDAEAEGEAETEASSGRVHSGKNTACVETKAQKRATENKQMLQNIFKKRLNGL